MFILGQGSFTISNGWGVVDQSLYTDNPDYASSVVNSEASTPSYDMSNALDETAKMSFKAWCDTESAGDYLDVYVSAPGEVDLKLNANVINELNPLLKYSEQVLYNSTPYQGKLGYLEYLIPDDYITGGNTQFKFLWNSDASANTGYRGCYIDTVLVSHVDAQNKYQYLEGTSMAAAFTTGVAALVWNAYPSLTASQVKQIIMDSGDYVADLDPVTGTHPIVSGNRLNAYRALVMAGQVAAGQTDVFLYPTIKSTPAGGYWSNAGTWEGGVVPGVSDIVEVRGDITLSGNETVAGLIIKDGVTLNAYGSQSKPTHTLTVTGDMVNNGSIKDYQGSPLKAGRLILNIDGNLENNGLMDNWDLDMNGNLLNTGSFQPTMSVTLAGDFTNNGVVIPNITFDGVNPQVIHEVGSTTLGLTLNNDVSLVKSMTITGRLYVNPGHTLSYDLADTLTANSTVSNGGVITGGDLILAGGNQDFTGNGDYDVTGLTLGGTGTKTVSGYIVVTGDLTVDAGVTLRPYARKTYSNITVRGNVLNNGSIIDVSGYWFGRIRFYLQSDLDNNGTMANYQTFASWDPVPGADSYDFQLTDTSDVWEAIQPNGTSTIKYIKTYVTQDRRWRWRSVTGGVPSAWSSDKFIN